MALDLFKLFGSQPARLADDAGRNPGFPDIVKRPQRVGVFWASSEKPSQFPSMREIMATLTLCA